MATYSTIMQFKTYFGNHIWVMGNLLQHSSAAECHERLWAAYTANVTLNCFLFRQIKIQTVREKILHLVQRYSIFTCKLEQISFPALGLPDVVKHKAINWLWELILSSIAHFTCSVDIAQPDSHLVTFSMKYFCSELNQYIQYWCYNMHSPPPLKRFCTLGNSLSTGTC